MSHSIMGPIITHGFQVCAPQSSLGYMLCAPAKNQLGRSMQDAIQRLAQLQLACNGFLTNRNLLIE